MKTFLLSVDGLSVEDFEALLSFMPRCSKLLRTFDLHEINHVFSSPQAIWAEILTGEPWFVNGCAGYSRPTNSLNKLAVTSERDLLVPPSLADAQSDEAPVVTINLPLVRPSSGRIWLSDGSLPINKLVSPPKLRDDKPFSAYEPRAVSNIAVLHLEETLRGLVSKCLAVESNRLDCAVALFGEQGWSRFIYRISVFDQLTHVLGMNFLRCEDLFSYPVIKEFADRLDSFIDQVMKRPDLKLAIVSGHSHTVCSGLLNLNKLLANGGLLQISADAAAAEKRTARVAAMTSRIGNRPIKEEMLGSMEGCLIPAATIAASPASGCVFVNRKRTFVDGCVDEDEYKDVCDKVELELRRRLFRRYGNTFVIERKCETAGKEALSLPEFIIHVDGVEFHNMRAEFMQGNLAPKTTHAPKGFAVLPKEAGHCIDKLALSQVKEVLLGFRAKPQRTEHETPARHSPTMTDHG